MRPVGDPNEQMKHQRNMELLSKEVQRPINEVEPVYDDVVKGLKQRAKIHEFVPIIAWRRTKVLLHEVWEATQG